MAFDERRSDHRRAAAETVAGGDRRWSSSPSSLARQLGIEAGAIGMARRRAADAARQHRQAGGGARPRTSPRSSTRSSGSPSSSSSACSWSSPASSTPALLRSAGQRLVEADRRRSAGHRPCRPVGVGGAVGDRRQHPVRRDDDPADQGDGADLRRSGGADAVVVGTVAGRLPRRQRHADRRLGQPDRRRHRRAQRHSLPLPDVHQDRLSADAASTSRSATLYLLCGDIS